MSTKFAQLIEEGILRVSDGYRAKNSELGGDGAIFLRSAYLQDNGFTLTNPDRFVGENAGHFGDKIAVSGDTVITTKGNSTGRVGYVQKNVEGSVYSPHLSYWRSLDHEVIVPRFLYFWSRSAGFLAQLHGLAYSTDMAPYFSLRDQMHIEIALPSVDEQREIAAILGSLDDKIEVNRKTAATLEEMARALYRSWFVDFDPVHAKAAGRPPAHMDPTTAALFPDSFDEDGLPEGWLTTEISKIAKSMLGGTPARKNELMWGGSIPWINSGAINQFRITAPSEKITELGMQKSSTKLLPKRTTVLAITGATLGQVSLTEIETCANQSVVGIVPEANNNALIYCGLQETVTELISHQTGGAQQHINKGNVENHKLVFASPEINQKFAAEVDLLLDQISNRLFENQTLATLRDTLLPRLMSGELRVGEAREQVEEVV